jgi:uncharacterized protein YfaP (DUF2135 family)
VKARNPIAWCAIDTLCCLLLVIYVMVAPPQKDPPAIPTFGSYAVVMSWPGESRDDVDLHVEDPHGLDAYFASSTTRTMNLEHDTIPSYDVAGNEKNHHERTIVRAAEPGEYIVNAQLYTQVGPPAKVTVTLYRLRGADEQLATSSFTLTNTGDERTAFRFRLNTAGDVVEINHLQKTLVREAP